MLLKKIALVSVMVGCLWAAISPAYANDDVTFYIELRGPLRVTAADAPLRQVSETRWEFQHTNIYKDDDVIPSSSPQTQSGVISVETTNGSHGSCTVVWEHKFWKSKEKESSTHDRFNLYTMLGSGCIVHSDLHKSGGKPATISFREQRQRGGNGRSGGIY